MYCLTVNLDRVSLSVEDKLVGRASLDLDVRVISEDEVQVLEGLSKEETLLNIVEASTVSLVDIVQAREARAGAALLVDVVEASPSHVLVLLVTSDTVRVVDALHGLGAEDVVGNGGPETSLLVEVLLVGGRGVGGVVGVNPVEDLGTDTRGGLEVGLEVGLGELKTEVDVFLLLEDDTGEDVVAADEAGHFREQSVNGNQ